MRLVEEQRSFLRVCLAAETPTDAVALSGMDREGLLLYRHMVQSRLVKMLKAGLPRTHRTLGKAAFERAVAGWLDARPPNTRFIREVVPAFVDFVLPTWRQGSTGPPWLADLVRWECALWELGYGEFEAPGEIAEFHFDGIPVLHPSVRVLTVGYGVHRDAQRGDGLQPRAEPLELCLGRHPDTHRVSTRSVSRFGGALLGLWRSEAATVTETVRRAAAAQGLPVDAALVDELSTLLADFLQSRIVLGVRPRGWVLGSVT